MNALICNDCQVPLDERGLCACNRPAPAPRPKGGDVKPEEIASDAVRAVLRAPNSGVAEQAIREALRTYGESERQKALEEAAKRADVVSREFEDQWNAAGGEEGSPEPEWFRHVPFDQWARQVARYSGSGGTDAAEEVAKQIRALSGTSGVQAEGQTAPENASGSEQKDGG